MYWILATLVLSGLFYLYVIKPLGYWRRKGVSQRSTLVQLRDLVRLLLQRDVQADIIKELYDEFPDKRFSGTYKMLRPVLILRDPELIKQITVKDFDHFVDHVQFMSEDIEPLWGKNLFALRGEKWRDMRATLSPSFTSSKMRSMFVLMDECAQQFVTYFKKDKQTQIVEMKEALSRYTNDIIATTAFGVVCDSLTDRNNEFYVMGKEATSFRGFWNLLKFFIMMSSPTFSKFFGIKIFSTNVNEFFRRLVKTNMDSREKNGIVRPDMIHLLMEARNGRLKHEDHTGVDDTGFAVVEESLIGKEVPRKPKLTDDDLTAQALIFFFAGFEALSASMSFLTYELAVNPEIQETLRKEVDEAMEMCSGAVTYEKILDMKYMDMVISECLRKWSTAIATDRICVKPYTIQPVNDKENPIRIEVDTMVWLPMYAIQRDPKFYPNPERFDPERFSDENKHKIKPYTFLPFGAGPRSCIANRFALLAAKTILYKIVAHFDVLVCEKTEIPLKLAKDTFDIAAENGYWVALRPRDT